MGCSHVRAQVSHLLEAQPVQATKSAGQNSGVRIRGTKIAGLMQRMEDSSLRLIVRLSIVDLRSAPHCGAPTRWSRRADLKVGATSASRNGALTLRDVKNEDRTGNVYENTGDDDKMSGEKTGFYTKMHPLREDQQESVGFLGRECISYTIRQDGRRQTVDGKRGKQWAPGVGCQGPGQALSGSWREAIKIATPFAGSPRCARNKRGSSFRVNMSESFISFK